MYIVIFYYILLDKGFLDTSFDTKSKNLLEKDTVNAENLRKRWPQDIEYMGGRNPFYNDNLSYAHEDFKFLNL